MPKLVITPAQWRALAWLVLRAWPAAALACPWQRTILKALLLLGLIWLDPFGFSATTNQVSRVMEDRLAAVLQSDTDASRVAVVLVGQDALRAAQESWPPSLPFWDDLVRGVSLREPLAIFLDVVLGVDRDARDTTLGQLAAAPALGAGGRLVLADSGRAALRLQRDPDSCGWLQTANCRPSAITEALRPQELQRAFIDWTIHGADPRAYPLREAYAQPIGADRSTESEVTLSFTGWTPAAVLAEIACRDTPTSFCDLPRGQRPPGLPLPAHRGAPALPPGPAQEPPGPLVPRWLLYAPSDLLDGTAPLRRWPCTPYRADEAGHWALRYWRAAGVVLLSALPKHLDEADWRRFFLLPDFTANEPAAQGQAQGSQQACFAFPVILAEDLLAPSGALRDALRDALRRRVVLIGIDLPTAPDVIVSPLHAQVPGVMLHAAALDTLIRYGAEYPTLPAETPVGLSSGDLAEYAVKLALLVLATIASHCRRHVGGALLLALLGLLAPLLFGLPVFAAANVAELMLVGLALAADQAVEAARAWLLPPLAQTPPQRITPMTRTRLFRITRLLPLALLAASAMALPEAAQAAGDPTQVTGAVGRTVRARPSSQAPTTEVDRDSLRFPAAIQGSEGRFWKVESGGGSLLLLKSDVVTNQAPVDICGPGMGGPPSRHSGGAGSNAGRCNTLGR